MQVPNKVRRGWSSVLIGVVMLGVARPAEAETGGTKVPMGILAPRGADGEPRQVRAETWDTWGEARVRGIRATTGHVQGAKGESLDPGGWVATRLVAGGRYQVTPQLRFELELEALNGQIAGDTTVLGTALTSRPFPVARDGAQDAKRVLPRKALVAWTSDVGLLVLGAQTFSWGTGMLVNDGAGDPTFGDAWQGNVVARLLFATRPLDEAGSSPLLRSMAVFLGADWVLRDDNASVYDGDRAFAGVFGVRAQHGEDTFGLLLAGRAQTDREDQLRPDGKRAKTSVLVLDSHVKTAWPIGATGRLQMEAEGALISGRSTRLWSDATWQDSAEVRQLGGVGRVRWDEDDLRLTAQLEGGYASGDNNPRDEVARTFTMHTDHNVGLVLFEHLLPLLTARGVDRLADPALMAQAPPGTRFAINPGSVQNAVYAHPSVRYRPVRPLDLRLGYLFAAPAADVLDAYQTGIRGGFPASYGGQVQNRGAYGHEVDARATWEFVLPSAVRLRVGSEGGVLLPGAAFAGVPGLRTEGGGRRTVWLSRATLSLYW
ncbi:MAG: hypothetical protein RMJ98_05495 [Myxococcales bacterium]|nr:hypothetical protein [Polyangiaceae bacterium]MDW8248745.1 hypothetical protein [Myxococcales bacterium]